MGFIGFKDDLKELSAGTYYLIKDTGEVYDSEYDIENYGWSWRPHSWDDDPEFYYSADEIENQGYDEEQDGEWVQEPFTFESFTVEPVYITLQNDPSGYDEFVWSYNINRGFDNIPPDMVGKATESESMSQAVEEAKKMAKDLSQKPKYLDEPIGVTFATAEAYGDIEAVYLNGKEI